MSITAWSTTASQNGNRLVSGNFLENQAPSTVNDAGRSVMAQIRSWANNIEWFEFGTGSNTISYTRVSATQISMSVDVVDEFHVNRRVRIVDGQGTILYGRVTSSSFSSPNTALTFEFDSGTLGSGNPTSVSYGIISATNTSLPSVVPTGTILMTGGASADSGYLICDGTAYSRTTYSALFTKISTTFGVGNGSSTFNIPNLQAKFPLGKSGSHGLGTTGGAFAQTPTGTNSSPSFTGSAFTPSGSVSVSGTVAGHSITQAQLPNINLQTNEMVKIEQAPANRGSSSGAGATYSRANIPLGGSGQAHSHGWSGSATFSGTSATPSGSVSAPNFTGSVLDTTNPYIALNYQIKY
jgi:microcystin-dependent protein